MASGRQKYGRMAAVVPLVKDFALFCSATTLGGCEKSSVPILKKRISANAPPRYCLILRPVVA